MAHLWWKQQHGSWRYVVEATESVEGLQLKKGLDYVQVQVQKFPPPLIIVIFIISMVFITYAAIVVKVYKPPTE